MLWGLDFVFGFGIRLRFGFRDWGLRSSCFEIRVTFVDYYTE